VNPIDDHEARFIKHFEPNRKRSHNHHASFVRAGFTLIVRIDFEQCIEGIRRVSHSFRIFSRLKSRGVNLAELIECGLAPDQAVDQRPPSNFSLIFCKCSSTCEVV
jgi:hypothetical protein